MKRRVILAVGALGLVILALCGVAGLSQDLSGILPQNDHKLRREAQFFVSQGTTRVLVVEAEIDASGPGNKVNPDALRPALEAVITTVAAYGAHPPATGGPSAIAHAGEVIYAHLPELTTPAALAALADAITPAALTARLAALREHASRPDDQFTAVAGRRDPLALAAQPLTELAGPAGAVPEGAIFRHPDGRHAMVVLDVDFPPDAVSAAGRLIDVLATLATTTSQQGVTLRVIGPYRHYVENTRTIWNDILSTLPICLALVAIILRTQLGTWRTVLVVHLPALVGMVGALAGAGIWHLISGQTMPIALIGFADGFLGIAVDYGNHLAAAKRAGHRPVLPLVVSFLTTAAGFAVLLTSSVPALQFLAAMVIGGLGTALVVALFVMPNLLPPPGGRDAWVAISGPLYRWCGRQPWRRLGVVGALTLLTLPGLWRLHFETDLRRYDGSHPQSWRDLEDFSKRWSGGTEAGTSVIASAPNQDTALATAAAARTKLHLPLSVVEHLLPDRAEQLRRRQAWNAWWRDHPHFADDFRAACVASGMRPQAFTDALRLYAPVQEELPEDGPFVTLDSWQGTPMETPLGLYVTRLDPQTWQVASPVRGLITREQVTLWDEQLDHREQPLSPADATGPIAWIANRGDFGARILDGLKEDLVRRGPWVLVLVAAVIIIAMRRPAPIAAVLAPPLLALVWTFGTLGWIGLPLTPFSLLAAAFILGIGIDSAVFLADSDEAAFSPIIAVWVTTLVGVGSMAFSVHPVLRTIGISLSLGMTAAFIAAILITPAVLALLQGKTTPAKQH